MASVTQRIKQIQQPRNGYLNPHLLKEEIISHQFALEPATREDLSPVIVGLTVDYLTRFYQGAMAEEAFQISAIGFQCYQARCAQRGKPVPTTQGFLNELKKLKPSLDDQTICTACNLVQYDVYYRSGIGVIYEPTLLQPNATTIANIQKMVRLSDNFRERFGPVVLDGFNFPGAYTSLITSGDGDFTTKDTLWDMKVSKHPPTKEHTLQLIIYYLMGMDSEHRPFFEKIRKIGIYNPRLNRTYTYEIRDIDPLVLATIAHEIIGY